MTHSQEQDSEVEYLHPDNFKIWHAAVVAKIMYLGIGSMGMTEAWYRWYWDRRNDTDADYIRDRLDKFNEQFAIERLRGNTDGTSR